MTTVSYEELTSRNIGILGAQNQDILKSIRVLIAGCGVGSLIAELAARTGFGSLLLVDGDEVEASNLNRQAYLMGDIGRNKADVTAELVRRINPGISIEISKDYLDITSAADFAAKADIIVDSLDISALPVILSLHDAAIGMNKHVLFPLNLGWGSGLFLFNRESATFADMLGIDGTSHGSLDETDLEAYILPKWAGLLEKHLPHDYLYPMFMSFLGEVEAKGWCPVPQLGIASFLTASVTVAAMIKVATGATMATAPEMVTLDALMATEPKECVKT